MFLPSSLPREATLSIPRQMLIRLIVNLQHIHLAIHFALCEVTHSSPNYSWRRTLHTPATELFWAAKMGHARWAQVERKAWPGAQGEHHSQNHWQECHWGEIGAKLQV